MLKKTFYILVIGIWFAVSASFAYAESYDKYAAIYPEDQPKQASAASKALVHWPTYPFEIIKYPVDKSLVAIEKYHVDKKIQWMYEWLDNFGISPKFGLLNPSSLRVGADFDLARMARLKQIYPNAVLNSWVHYAGDDVFKIGAEAGWERIADTGMFVKTLADYDDRHREHFYGIGPDTSAGEGNVYELEQTTIQQKLGYTFDFVHEINVSAAYKNVNASGGKDGGRGQFGDSLVFNESVVPGLHGDEIFSLAAELIRDSRNQKENSTTGGVKRAAFSYNEGLYGSDARFFKYELEGSQYFRLWSDRRVLVFHGYGVHNDELGSNYVPFHQMPRLGGHGTSPDLSRTLRGFDQNRFTDESAALWNLEYRYTIWEYRDWKTDTILFWDQGQTFGEFSEFQMKDFRESYGLGFRVSLANVVLLSTEIAHGDEGTNLYVRSSAPF